MQVNKRSRGAGWEGSTRTESGVVMAWTWIPCLFFAVVAIVLGGVGIAGVSAARNLGNSIAGEQLASTTISLDLQRALKDARSSSQMLMLPRSATDDRELRSKLFQQAIPSVEARLADLRNIHEVDSADERADIAALTGHWTAVRRLIGAAIGANQTPDRATDIRIIASFDQIDQELIQVSGYDRAVAGAAAVRASNASRQWTRSIGIGVLIAVLGSLTCGWLGSRRMRTALEPGQDQVRFADTLQMAESEDEAHSILKRHLEREIGPGGVTVLNRNNSADRLEAVTAVPAESMLLQTLSHARPNWCLAVRAGRRHIDDGDEHALLVCPVCGPCAARSACFPLTVGGAVIGSVLVSGSRALEIDILQRAQESVAQAAPVLANLRNLAIAEVRASTDALTALPNKRTVGDTLRRMLAQASRNLSPLSLLTLDLDHFKQVNDQFGHPVGDQALAAVGAALRSILRTSDFAGRNGGEEFSVMLPDTDLAGAAVTAEKIRSTVAGIVLPGVDLVLTVSIGIAAYPEHALTTERLERLADSALYVAKRSGRNRVEVATVAGDSVRPDSPAPQLTRSIEAGTRTAAVLD